MRLKTFLKGFILFLLFYMVTYCTITKLDRANADEPTITIPYTEKEMCKAFLKAEICDMSKEQQEQYFLQMFEGLLDREFNKEQEVESMEICFKETEEGKLIPCKGLDI